MKTEDNLNLEINVPTDNEGFVLLKCPKCKNLFKLKPSDYQSDSVFSIYCPSCGLISDNYITEDILELALKKINNYMNDYLTREFKELEKRSKGSLLQFKIESDYKKENEQPIMLRTEKLEKKEYICCKMQAKIKSILKMSGSYCPYCGVMDYGIE